MRQITKQAELCAKAGFSNRLDYFRIDFARKANLQARSEIGGFGAQTGKGIPKFKRIPVGGEKPGMNHPKLSILARRQLRGKIGFVVSVGNQMHRRRSPGSKIRLHAGSH